MRQPGSTALGVRLENVYLFRGLRRSIENRVAGRQKHLFIVMSAGRYTATWTRNGHAREAHARAGDVVYWPAGIVRTDRSDPDDPMRAITITVDWDDAPRADDDDNFPHVVRDAQGLIAATAQCLLMAQNDLLPRRREISSSFAASIAAEYLRLADASGGELVAKVVHYTQENLRRRLTLTELSRHVRLEKHYFCGRYKALTGRTPMQDVRRIRIERALEILRRLPDMPLKDVAYRVGMGNPQLLARWLKRSTALTSREIRASVAR